MRSILGNFAKIIILFWAIQLNYIHSTKMANSPSILTTLSGRPIPIIYGTAWKKERTTELVLNAILAGFRGIDTACQPKHYSEDLVATKRKHMEEDLAVTAMNPLSREEIEAIQSVLFQRDEF